MSATIPCPFCAAPLVTRKCYGHNHLRCAVCIRDVCYRAQGGQLVAEQCKGVEAYDPGVDRCPGCGGHLVKGCPRFPFNHHIWCAACNFCFAHTKKRVKCGGKLERRVRCHHCNGTGIEPTPEAPPRKEKRAN